MAEMELPEIIAWIKRKTDLGSPLQNTSKLIAALEALLPKPKVKAKAKAKKAVKRPAKKK